MHEWVNTCHLASHGTLAGVGERCSLTCADSNAAFSGVKLLEQTPRDLRSVIGSERIAINFDELRAMETARLEALVAKAVFSKMMRSRKRWRQAKPERGQVERSMTARLARRRMLLQARQAKVLLARYNFEFLCCFIG